MEQDQGPPIDPSSWAISYPEFRKLNADIAQIMTSLRAIEDRLDSQRGIVEQGQVYDRHFATLLDGAHHWLNRLVTEQDWLRGQIIAAEDQRRDLILSLVGRHLPPLGWTLEAERGLAADSIDHIAPRGTLNDNTRHPRFVVACEARLGAVLQHLDLGCAGGGLVWDFTLRGHRSVGIEGSNRSALARRSEWRIIPDRLFTADIRHRFAFRRSGGTAVAFDVITAWEVFEHIPEDGIDGMLDNIARGLRPGGLLITSIATFVDRDAASGTVWHETVQPREWWLERLRGHGLVPSGVAFEVEDFVRGVGNPRAGDWDVRVNPEMGFHLVLEKRG